MKFDLNKSIEILTNTPTVMESLLHGLSNEWLYSNEGPDSWSPFDVLGHLVHCERTDWMERTLIILNNVDKNFKPVDRFAQLRENEGKSITDLLKDFKSLRHENIAKLKELDITVDSLDKKGIHPAFGEVTLRQLLSTWVVHDLNHLSQISRVMAKQYKKETGPWVEYLPILKK